jgi:hypothetical protein
MSERPAIVVGEDRGLGFTVQEVWVALVRHGDGDEAVPGVMMPNGMWAPLVAADPKRLEWIREQARIISRESGKAVRIVRFSTREDLETIKWG